MVELEAGIRRVTFALPLGIDHVHCYLLEDSEGGWTLVDTGLGLPDAAERWQSVLADLERPINRIVITHFHPDHIGAAADVAGLTGAAVHQGAEDFDQCLRTWGLRRGPGPMPSYLRAHGTPEPDVEAFESDAEAFSKLVHFVPDPELLRPGDEVDGWQVWHLPGHADGHIALLRDGVLAAGDTLLASITPNVGLYPDSRPDPLGDYLESLERIAELGLRLALPGHHEPLRDPTARARELIEHHAARLEQTTAALDRSPRSAYEVSLTLFPDALPPVLRRFALAETRAHLEYLVLRDRATRAEEGGRVSYLASR